MFRKSVVAAGILLLAVTTRTLALGLGEIDVRSTLNEPFNAVVTLTSATDEQLEVLKVSIASREAFTRAGIPRPQMLSDFLFEVERTSAGTPIVRITTARPIREPFLEFLLEVAWPNGRLLRQYTILVDPPVTMPVTPPAPVVPVTPVAQPRATAPPPPPEPRPQVQPVTAPATAPPPPPVREAAPSTYGPVRRNDTLWSIASRVRPGSDITIEQMMLALQRANPRAFINNNINNLRRDAVLDVPTREEVLAIGVAEARQETRRQTAEWRERRSKPAEPETQGAAAPAPAPAPVTEARLQLVAPEDELVAGTAAPGETAAPVAGDENAQTGAAAAEVAELRQQLTLANEEAEASRAQAAELDSRVSQLEAQLSDMKRLLELKDEQLASIQAGLTSPEAPAEAGAVSEEAGGEPQADAGAATETVATAAPATPSGQPTGLVDRMMNNPMLTGLGVIVAMVLGGIIWAATRQRRSDDLFSDEPTMESRLAVAGKGSEPPRESVAVSDKAILTEMAASEADVTEIDPVKEADIFLAYGRVQQAEDVLLEGLEKDPTSRELKLKLLEVYHAGGNTEAFNNQAKAFRNLVNEDDPQWQQIAVMGYEMSPDNPLYQTGRDAGSSAGGVDFDMDLSGMEDSRAHEAGGDETLEVDYAHDDRETSALPDSLEFNLAELGGSGEEEDAGEGLLENSDEVSTKLDLARAYIDMGDPDGARSILEEVLEEGSDTQKNEAEGLFAKLA